MTPDDPLIPDPHGPRFGPEPDDRSASPTPAGVPHSIPFARPVFAAISPWQPEYARPAGTIVIDYGKSLQPPLARWRSLFELIMLVPAGFFGGMMGFLVAKAMGVTNEQWQLVGSTFGMGAGCLAAVALFVFIDNQRAADIGWTSRDFLPNIGIGIAALIGTYILAGLMFLAIAILHPSILEHQETAAEAVKERIPPMSFAQMALFMAAVAAWEEIVFRGFVLTRLKALLASWWLAVPVASILFGAIHTYEGPLAVAMITVLGLAMAALFLWRKSLVPCITMHFLNNVAMLLLLHAET